MRLLRPAFSALLFGTLPTLPTLHAQYGAETTLAVEGPRSVQVLDMDTDGDNDVVVTSREGLIVLYNTDGAGSLSSPVHVSTDDVTGHAADLDGDGYPDLVGTQLLSGGIRWYRNLGTFGFGPAQPIAFGVTAEEIAALDADGDGDMDLIARLGDMSIVYYGNTNGLGAFAAPVNIGFGAPNASITVCDADGDGDMDLVWSMPFVDQTFWSQNIGGTNPFAAGIPYVLDARAFQADADGDGTMDRILVRNWMQQAAWQRGTATGIDPATEQLIDANLEMTSPVLVADLDGDGDLDLAVGNTTTGEVCWYANLDGQGNFGARQVVATGVDMPMLLAAGDLDGDGDLELFSASASQQRVIRWDNLARAGDMIVGRVFNDLDNDGYFGHDDHGLYNIPVQVSGLGTTFTNHSGVYWFSATPGSYSATCTMPMGWQATTALTHNVSLAAVGSSALNVDFGLRAVGTNHQLAGSVTPGPQRCSMGVPYGLTVINTGNQIEDVTLTLDLNDLSSFISADPAPTSNAGGLITWAFNAVQPTHHRQVALVVQMPGSDHMDELLIDELALKAFQGGTEVFQDNVASEGVVECAYDPNDKHVWPAGVGPTFLTAMDAMLMYTIRFQNTGNAVAYDVEITDQLDPSIDPHSICVLSASHTQRTHIDPAGLITFSFDNIMLPDSGSNEPESHGHVRFTARAFSGLAEGTQVFNHADIYFDFNPAITTNTVLNTLTYGMVGMEEETTITGELAIVPNPVVDQATVVLPNGMGAGTRLTLHDATGRQVKVWTASGERHTIEVGVLPEGLYILRAFSASGERSVRVLVGR